MKKQFKICPDCGAHLDPGERCDCRDKKETASGAATPKAEQAVNANQYNSMIQRRSEPVNRVLQFNPQASGNKAYPNTAHKVFYGTFRKSNEQERITIKIASDLGGMFNLFSLSKDMIIELLGIGTLATLSNDVFAKRCYARKLVEALEFLEEVAQ